MGNTYAAANILVIAVFCQVVNLSFSLIHIQCAVGIDHCNTSRVVATIFQTTKTLNQNRISVFLSYISYYSTHNILVSFLFWMQRYK